MSSSDMNKFEEIERARSILDIGKSATIDEIKASYKILLKKWHPDMCKDNSDECKEMTRNILWAYQTIMKFINQYRFAFSKEEIEKYITKEEWWYKHFGDTSHD